MYLRTLAFSRKVSPVARPCTWETQMAAMVLPRLNIPRLSHHSMFQCQILTPSSRHHSSHYLLRSINSFIRRFTGLAGQLRPRRTPGTRPIKCSSSRICTGTVWVVNCKATPHINSSRNSSISSLSNRLPPTCRITRVRIVIVRINICRVLYSRTNACRQRLLQREGPQVAAATLLRSRRCMRRRSTMLRHQAGEPEGTLRLPSWNRLFR